MELKKIKSNDNWLDTVRDKYDFMYMDRGRHIYEIERGSEVIPVLDGAEITEDELRDAIAFIWKEGDTLHEYAPFRRADGIPTHQVKDRILVAVYDIHGPSAALTMAQKMELLDGAAPEDVPAIQRNVYDGVAEVSDDGRVRVRKDLRALISRRLAEEGVTQSALARRLGKDKQHVSAFLRGKVPMPLDDVEEILFLIGEGNMYDERKEDGDGTDA